jgi:hypothetical protein
MALGGYFVPYAIFCDDRARVAPHEGQTAAVAVAYGSSRAAADQNAFIDQTREDPVRHLPRQTKVAPYRTGG